MGDGIGLRGEDYGTHTFRRTKASIISRGTVRYLGVDIEGARALVEDTEV
jgi:hypothetical protein